MLKIEYMNKPDQIGAWGSLKAAFSVVTEEGFIIKGVKLIKGQSGDDFIGMPSEKGKDGEYRDTVLATKELKEQIKKLALQQYLKDQNGADVMNDSITDISPPDDFYNDMDEQKKETSQEKAYDDDIPF